MISNRVVNKIWRWQRYSKVDGTFLLLFYLFFSLSVFVMTAVFSTYLYQFPAGKNVQRASDITSHWSLLTTRLQLDFFFRKLNWSHLIVPYNKRKILFYLQLQDYRAAKGNLGLWAPVKITRCKLFLRWNMKN